MENGKKMEKMEKNGENSGPLSSLPVVRLNGDRLQRRPLVPKLTIVLCKEQAGAELGQGQLKLKLGFISIKI